MLQDLRFALRGFLAAPGLTAAALLSLALGIGANTAIFSVASALLLRPLPYEAPERLAILWNRSPGLGIAEDWFSTAQYFDIKSNVTSFDQVAAAIGSNLNLTGDGEPERVGTVRVTSSLLPMIGARAEIGRLFTADDDATGAAPVAILHHGTWVRRYGRDAGVLERSIDLNGRMYRVIGVMAEGFTLPREVLPTLGGAEEAEILLPLSFGPNASQTRSGEDYNIMARLKPGVSVAAAQTELDALTARLRRDHPDFYPVNGGLTFSAVPLTDEVVGDVRRPLWILSAAVALVLLIACANVANLLVSRALARRKEIAVRGALGASRARVLRLLLTEGVALGLAGGLLGLLVAGAGVAAIRALGAGSVPRLHEIGLDALALLFTAAISIVSGILFSLWPARQLGRVDLQAALRTEGRGSSGETIWGRGAGLRRVLAAAEVALCALVLVAAGLLVRSFARVQDVRPGFEADGVLTLELTMAGRKYADAARVSSAYRSLWEQLDATPGVAASGGVTALPLSDMFAWGPITVEGRTPPPGEKFLNVDQRTVAGRYFEAMRIPLVRGRFFSEDDTPETGRVVVIDARMADELWPGQDPVGKRIRTGGFDARADTPWMTVIGVTGRVRQYSLDGEEPRIAMYHWHKQRPSRALNLVVRSAGGDAAALAPRVRGAVRAVDPDLPIYKMKTMEARVGESVARRRFAMVLLSVFGLLALGLAAIGTYGVMSYLVSQGAREIGIRLALGATPGGVARMVIRGGLIIAAFGVGAGLAAAMTLTPLMRSMLFGVEPADPITFGTIAGLLAVIALAAAAIPAVRAARIDPAVSLRAG